MEQTKEKEDKGNGKRKLCIIFVQPNSKIWRGRYKPKTRTILINENVNPILKPYVLFHELLHYIDDYLPKRMIEKIIDYDHATPERKIAKIQKRIQKLEREHTKTKQQLIKLIEQELEGRRKEGKEGRKEMEYLCR